MSRQPPSLHRLRCSEGSAVLAVAAAAVVSALAALLVLTGSGSWSLPSAANAPVDATVAVAYPLLGALVVRHGRGSRAVGLVLLGAGSASALTLLCTAIATSAPSSTFAARLLAQVAGAAWVPGFLPLVVLLPLVFPGGLRPGRKPSGKARSSSVTSGRKPGTHSDPATWPRMRAAVVADDADDAMAVHRTVSADALPAASSTMPTARLPRPCRTTRAPSSG